MKIAGCRGVGESIRVLVPVIGCFPDKLQFDSRFIKIPKLSVKTKKRGSAFADPQVVLFADV